MSINLNKIKKELNSLSDKIRAQASVRFFKTGKGEYGEGDIFLGIRVPVQRSVAKKYFELLDLAEVKELLQSKIHEHRFVALEVLVMKYEKGSEKEKKKIFDFYIKNLKNANNWDLVDTSAPYIAGEYLKDKDRSIFYDLAKSKNLWEKRVAIVSTNAFIQDGEYKDTLNICEILMNDTHDLIHKACGWMLREVYKKDPQTLEKFLQKHASKLPRTTLRYSIERMPEEKRRFYLIK